MAELREIETPEHLNNMVEFRLLNEVTDEMYGRFDDDMQDVFDDLLITTSTEEGIARRENILGIVPNPDDSLEVRRTTVLFWWYNRMPYTRRVIESKIESLCGTGNYTFEFDVENQILHIGISASLGWDVVRVVNSLLDRLVMLSVILDVKAVTVDTIEPELFTGSVRREIVKNAVHTDM